MTTNSRRAFLIGSGGSGLLLASGGLNTLLGTETRLTPRTEITTLQAIVDTIIPAAEQAGALDMGLDIKLLHFARSHPEWKASIPQLAEQCNRQALSAHHHTFNLLSLTQRERLLGDVLKGKAPARFVINCVLVRNQLIEWYYTSPHGLAVVEYLPPSQYPAYQKVRRI